MLMFIFLYDPLNIETLNKNKKEKDKLALKIYFEFLQEKKTKKELHYLGFYLI
jgi:hypothetical protein